MDNPLFLVIKGIKAKKKRLGGGGGGNLLGTKLAVVNSKAATNLASVGLTVVNNATGAFHNDLATGSQLRRAPVDDFIANLNGVIHFNSPLGQFNHLDDGTTEITVASPPAAFEFSFEASIDVNAGSTTDETLNLSVIKNTANATVTMFQQTDTIRFIPAGAGFHGNASVGCELSAYSVGDVIFKVNITGGGSDTDSNVVAETAQTSDAYYLKVVFV